MNMIYTESIKDDAIRIRVNHKIKDTAESILHTMGMTISQAINMYLAQIVVNRSIPFNIETSNELPNKETIKVIKEARANKGLIKSKNINALFKELGI